MDYNECLTYLKGLNEKYGISPGLDVIKKLLFCCGNPENESRIIHVAGTNGKGSVSTFISCILSEAGYRVGRYISPAVNGYREKVQYVKKGKTTYISENEVCKYINFLKEKSEDIFNEINKHPTEFEIETTMAFMAFSDWKCDYVVLECGMGGELDATNAAENKELCVFTSIAMDHTRYLGSTLSEIAENKAGILRKDVCAVSSIQVKEVSDVLKRCADRFGCSLRFINEYDIVKSDKDGNVITYDKKEWKIPLPGIYQAENAAVAIEAVKMLSKGKFKINDVIIQKGFNNARWPKRFEKVNADPYVIIDGAHNPCGIKVLVESIDKIFPKNIFYRIGIMGVFADKDVKGMAFGIKGVFNELHTVTPPGRRGLSADKLSKVIYEVSGEYSEIHENIATKELCTQITEAVDKEKKCKTVIVIFGSLSLTAEN